MVRSTNTIVCVLAIAALFPAMADGKETHIDFNRDIRSILSNHCFQCHGPDENQRKAELRLDSFSGATTDLGGYAAIVPGTPKDSELLNRVRSKDTDIQMPPIEQGDRLTEHQITLLEKWIEQGAAYAKHWSFRPIERPEVPSLPDTTPPKWKENRIDAFIYRQLSEHGIQPSPEADRPTLIRRVSLDLLGLPPTLDQIDSFVTDRRPSAFERMVDRTLNSECFGERWGRHWLDQARYADSHGYTNDNERSMWPYRDWVIDAFNRDLPFDQFTIEQLAGDLLKNATIDQLVATGFHRNTLINSEGGTKTDQFRDEQVKDRIDTTGLVWMGLTVGCAKCHPHKFDPISQAEYYRLYAFFNSTADQNSVTPTLKVPSDRQLQELEKLRQQEENLALQIETDKHRAARQAVWEAAVLARPETIDERVDTVPWTVLELSGKSDKQSTFAVLDDLSLLVRGKGATKEEYQSTARSPLTKIRSVRLEVLTDDSLPKRGPGRAGNGNFVLSEFWFRTGDGRELHFSKAAAEHSQRNFEIAKTIDGKTDTGWAIDGAPEGDLNHSRTAWFILPEALEVEENHGLVFKMQFHLNDNCGIGRYRLSISSDEWIDRPDPRAIAKLLAVPMEKRSVEQQSRIDKAFIQSDPQLRDIDARLSDVVRRIETVKRQIPSTMIFRELETPRQAYVQIRGDFLRRGADVVPNVPEILPPLDPASNRDRLAFAKWLVRSDHPLTSRVRVNRIWMRIVWSRSCGN